MHKCFWTIVKYEWEDGEAHMEEYDTEESSKNGTTDKRVTLTSGGDFSKIHVIRRIGANQSYRSLGVFLAANGCQLKQKQVLQEKSRTWSIKMRNSFLTGEEKLISYRQQLLPSLQFPLSCTMMTQQQLNQVQFPSLQEAINAMGLNSTFPRCILFGDRRYQGLQMANLYVRQGTDKLKMYIGHTRLNSETGKLLAIEKSYVELLSGQGKCPLANPEINEDSWAATSWI